MLLGVCMEGRKGCLSGDMSSDSLVGARHGKAMKWKCGLLGGEYREVFICEQLGVDKAGMVSHALEWLLRAG